MKRFLPCWLRLMLTREYVVRGSATIRSDMIDRLVPGRVRCVPADRDADFYAERSIRLAAEVIDLRKQLNAERDAATARVIRLAKERDQVVELLEAAHRELTEEAWQALSGDVRDCWANAILAASYRRAPRSCAHPSEG